MEVVHPRWSAWSFLVYAGGLVVIGATAGWLSYLAAHSGSFGYAAWSLLVLALLAVVAGWFRSTDHPVAAGIFAFVALIAFVALLAALWKWFGWSSPTSSSSGLRGFHPAQLLLELLWLVAALAALRRFRFPLIAAQAALAGWIVVTDVLSNGGSWSAVVTLFVGLVYLAVALAVDGGPRRPYGFWLHLGSGLLIGGSLLWFWHGGNVEWTLIVIASLVYVQFAQAVGRSSWAVLGAVGLLIATTHFTLEWTHVQFFFVNGGHGTARAWVPPLVFTCLGFVLVALGLRSARRGGHVGPELT